MGVAFLSNRCGLMKREDAFRGTSNKWQILVVRHTDVKIIGVYVTPSASAIDWAELLAE